MKSVTLTIRRKCIATPRYSAGSCEDVKRNNQVLIRGDKVEYMRNISSIDIVVKYTGAYFVISVNDTKELLDKRSEN